MALIKCDECNKEISDKVKSCPHCGVKTSSKKGYTFRFRWFIYAVILIFLIWRFGYSDSDNKADTTLPVINTVKYIYDDELQVEEDYYRYFQLELTQDTDVTIDYKILSGPNMDVYFLSKDDFYIWERIIKENTDEPFYYNDKLSTFNTSISSKTITVPKGNYFVVLDNTDYGPTYPPMNLENDFVTMDLTISIK